MSLLRPPTAFRPRMEAVDPRGLLTSGNAPAAIFVGGDVDDATYPPTFERNRFVADLVLHYACLPFLQKQQQYQQEQQQQQRASGQETPSPPQAAAAGADLSALRWDDPVPANELFLWYNERLPPVGLEELSTFHDPAYVRFLSVRETLSDIDERAAEASQARAAAIQPSMSRRSSISPRVERPLRVMPDLQPVPDDSDFGLRDAVPFVGLWRTIQATAGGTLTAARWLMGATLAEQAQQQHQQQQSQSAALPLPPAPTGRLGNTPVPTAPAPSPAAERMVALHWFGGRHHAKRDAAGGLCFINDVVLGAIALRQGLPAERSKLLIVDLDAHHGDGTFEAFQFDPDVMTLSVHGFGAGFYPGSGAIADIGMGQGRGSNVNVPLPEGSGDRIMVPLARHAIRAAARKLGDAMGAVVLVCGADGLQGDSLGHMNYSVAGLQCVVRLVLELCAAARAKLLVLGAGGYVDTSTARLDAVVTRDVLSWVAARARGSTDYFAQSPNLVSELGVAVPDSCHYFTRYGPSFLMHGLPPPACELVKTLPEEHPLHKVLEVLNNRAADSRAPSAGFRHS